MGHDQYPGGPVGLALTRSSPPARPPATPACPSAWTRATTRSRMSGIRLGQHPVAEVEDMARGVPGRPEYLPRLGGGHLPGGQAHGRVEVALDGDTGPDTPPGVVQRDPPVDTHDGAAGSGHRGQQLARAHPEQDGGNPVMGLGQLGEEPGGGGQYQLPVVVRGEDAGPAVEDLHGRRPGVQLGPERGQGQIGEPLHQLVPDHRFTVHERLDPGEILGRSPFHQVAGHRERPTGEPDQGYVQLGGQDAHRLDDVGRVDLGFERPEALEIVLDPEGLGHHRTGGRGHVHAEPDGGHRDHDVGEEDGGIGAVAVHRLPGELGHQLGLGDGVEDAALPSRRPVFGQRPARLAHEPDRHPFDGEPPARPDERGIVEPVRPDGTHSPVPRHASAGGRYGIGRSIPTGGTGPLVPRRFGCCGRGHAPSLGEGARSSTPAGPVAVWPPGEYNRGFP